MRVATEIGEKRVAHSQSAKEQEGMVPLKVCCVYLLYLFVCVSISCICACVFLLLTVSPLRKGGAWLCVCTFLAHRVIPLKK